MNILFLTHYFYPHIGGVEKHVLEVSKELIRSGNNVTVVTEKYNQKLKSSENIFGINIIRLQYPHLKIIGIVYIWFWFLKNYKIIKDADIVHCHDVFIWYLLSKIIFPGKKVYSTFHGWEGAYPLPLKNILIKRLSAKLSSGSIAVGNYIGKYYGIRPNVVVYGAANKQFKKYKKIKNSIVFIGRLQNDTGIEKFLEHLGKTKYNSVSFVGDGPLKVECQRYGRVYGFINPQSFLEASEYVVPGGYLSYIEALAYGCKVATFSQNKIKKDYWNDIKSVKKFYNWKNITRQYLNLWSNSL